MKPSIFCIGAAVLAVAQVFAQDHIAPCSGSGDHAGGICYGYATGRAAGNVAGDAVCDPLTFYQSNINTSFFTYFADGSLNGLQVGDIVKFSQHAAYVRSVGNPIGTSRVDQYSTMRSREETNVLLDDVKAEFGSWTGYYRRKTINVTVQNSFSGGEVKVNSSQGSAGTWTIAWWDYQSLEAVNRQTIEGYVRVYQYWATPSGNKYLISISIIPKPDQTYTANFKKEFNITFQNNFIGVGNAGVMKVKPPGETQYTQYTLPTSAFPIVQDQAISAEAISGQVYNTIKYTFTQWADGSTTNPRTFTPNDHTTYTANFTGKPLAVTITSSSGPVGTPVRIEWQEHPNPNVSQYQVWRKAKHNGVWYGPTLLATLNRGTTSFTDPDYLFTEGYTHDLLQYDIRAYYSTEGSYADPNWIATYGQLYRVLAESETQRPGPTEYAISNYPNPFNPVTNIAFQLVEKAHVALVVCNITGQRAIQLVDEDLTDGYYRLVWNGKDQNGDPLSNGHYFARLVISPINGGDARVLTQCMLFLK